MDNKIEHLLGRINELESKNRLINIQIDELKTIENELRNKEKELISDIEKTKKQLNSYDKEYDDLNNDILRVDVICKNVETTLHNEFIKVEMSANKVNKAEKYLEKHENKIINDLENARNKINNYLLNTNKKNELDNLNIIKNENFLLNQITLEELYEIYEKTMENCQDNYFKNQCDKISVVNYKNHAYFCNPTHLLNMINLLINKIKETNNDPHFNLLNVTNFFGIKEEIEKEEELNFGLSELNKIMINHYKTRKNTIST